MENVDGDPKPTFKLSVAAKNAILFVVAIVVLILFFLLPPNKEWLTTRILPYYNEFKGQRKNMALENRLGDRLGSAYINSKQIASFFEKQHIKNSALVLIPPADYFQANGIEYHVPEPAVFYYFTGLKTLWINSSNAADANWYVRVQNGNFIILKVKSKAALIDTLTAFKKYQVSL